VADPCAGRAPRAQGAMLRRFPFFAGKIALAADAKDGEGGDYREHCSRSRVCLGSERSQLMGGVQLVPGGKGQSERRELWRGDGRNDRGSVIREAWDLGLVTSVGARLPWMPAALRI
jgi:hypothetical protein